MTTSIEDGATAMGIRARSLRRGAGWTALACWAVHSGFHVCNGTWESALWTCNVGALVLALGLLSDRSRLTSIALLWLAIGTPTWLVALTFGRAFHPTSTLTHFAAPLAGLLIVARAGFPRGTWWRSLLLLLGLHAASHALVSDHHVNLIEVSLPAVAGYGGHVAFMVAIAPVIALAFLGLERAARRRFGPATS